MPAIDWLPTWNGLTTGRGVGETAGDLLGDAEGEAAGELLGGGAAAGLLVAALPHADRRIAPTAADTPRMREWFRNALIIVVSLAGFSPCMRGRPCRCTSDRRLRPAREH